MCASQAKEHEQATEAGLGCWQCFNPAGQTQRDMIEAENEMLRKELKKAQQEAVALLSL